MRLADNKPKLKSRYRQYIADTDDISFEDLFQQNIQELSQNDSGEIQ